MMFIGTCLTQLVGLARSKKICATLNYLGLLKFPLYMSSQLSRARFSLGLSYSKLYLHM